MNSLIGTGDRLFVRIRGIPFFLRLTYFTRLLLVAGFVPTGLVKLLGRRFTTMSVETPIGAFFEAMYQTGVYWQFIGAAQVVAGLFLVFPRLAHLGAALFMPIMVNIVAITVAIDFGGTPFVTSAMLLAVTYLCAWDYHRFRSLVTERPWPSDLVVPELTLDRWEAVGFAVFGTALLTFFGFTRGFVPRALALPAIMIGAAAGLWTLVRFATTGRHRFGAGD